MSALRARSPLARVATRIPDLIELKVIAERLKRPTGEPNATTLRFLAHVEGLFGDLSRGDPAASEQLVRYTDIAMAAYESWRTASDVGVKPDETLFCFGAGQHSPKHPAATALWYYAAAAFIQSKVDV